MNEKLKKIQDGWIGFLLPIIEEYSDVEKNDEPLDGDDVDRLCDIIKAKINLHQGNITEEEYEGIIRTSWTSETKYRNIH